MMGSTHICNEIVKKHCAPSASPIVKETVSDNNTDIFYSTREETEKWRGASLTKAVTNHGDAENPWNASGDYAFAADDNINYLQ